MLKAFVVSRSPSVDEGKKLAITGTRIQNPRRKNGDVAADNRQSQSRIGVSDVDKEVYPPPPYCSHVHIAPDISRWLFEGGS
jgi:hypothetical protein